MSTTRIERATRVLPECVVKSPFFYDVLAVKNDARTWMVDNGLDDGKFSITVKFSWACHRGENCVTCGGTMRSSLTMKSRGSHDTLVLDGLAAMVDFLDQHGGYAMNV